MVKYIDIKNTNLKSKKLKIYLINIIILSFSVFHINITQAVLLNTCINEYSNLNELIAKIIENNLQTNIHIYNCLADPTTATTLIANPADTLKLNTDPRIKLFKDSYNKSKACFYSVQMNNTIPLSFGFIEYAGKQIPLTTYKNIDLAGNNNCQIDTNPEKCNIKLYLEQNTPETRMATQTNVQQNFYGCYGNEDKPKFLHEFLNTENQDVNSFNVFDEEKGLIANSGQRSTLLSLANSQAGPIIGFINSFINYLVSIVFVLCMSSLIYGGYNLIFAGFDSDMTEKGKNAIKYAITGFLFIMLSYTIVILVQSIF